MQILEADGKIRMVLCQLFWHRVDTKHLEGTISKCFEDLLTYRRSNSRVSSPRFGSSILMTSAPKSASSIVARGAANTLVKSTILTPFSGGDIPTDGTGFGLKPIRPLSVDLKQTRRPKSLCSCRCRDASCSRTRRPNARVIFTLEGSS
jgi:hypothetical protein